jgi:glucans biosynthesis protein C
MSALKSSESDRVWCLDYARYWLVAIMVVFHCLISQMEYPVWPVVDPRPTAVAKWCVFWADIFQMPLLFFIAGYFTIPSLRPRGVLGFLRAKFFRLLVPAALVLVLLNPVHRYLYHYTRSFQEGIGPMSYFAYWKEFFCHANWCEYGDMVTFEFSLAHLWFVTLLFLFFVVTAVSVGWRQRFAGTRSELQAQEASERPILPTVCLAVFAQWAAGAILLFWVKLFDWVMIASTILFELPAVTLHVCFFTLGIVAYRRRWLSRPMALGSPLWWLVACVPLTVVKLALDDWSVADVAFLDSYPLSLAYWSVKTICCTCYLFLMLSFAVRYCNQPSRIQWHFASISYRVYLVHLVVVFLVQFAFWNFPGASAGVVLIGTAALTLILTYLAAISLSPLAVWYAAWTGGRRESREAVAVDPLLTVRKHIRRRDLAEDRVVDDKALHKSLTQPLRLVARNGLTPPRPTSNEGE